MTHALPARLGWAAASLALLLAAPSSAQDGGEVPARTHLVKGELVRLDLPRRVMVVKVAPAGKDPVEVEVVTDDATRISSRGRVLGFSEMRPGDHVLVSCTDEGTRHRAVLVKAGAGRN